jgi:3-hydroxymyristoyl/3-hydroxydecanoyl-(acyl carrier protein) dehydratase
MRYRFVDRILEIDAHGVGTITTSKAFARSEEFFDGTFRRHDEVPSSLVLEAMAAAGSFLLTIKSRYQMHALLLKVNRAAFPHPVRAGDQLIVRSRLAGFQGDWDRSDALGAVFGVAEVHAACTVGADPAADAALLFVGLPLSRTLGARREQVLAGMLELLGYVHMRR